MHLTTQETFHTSHPTAVLTAVCAQAEERRREMYAYPAFRSPAGAAGALARGAHAARYDSDDVGEEWYDDDDDAYGDDEDLEDAYHAGRRGGAGASTGRVTIGNRRWGANGYVSSGHRSATPAAKAHAGAKTGSRSSRTPGAPLRPHALHWDALHWDALRCTGIRQSTPRESACIGLSRHAGRTADLSGQGLHWCRACSSCARSSCARGRSARAWAAVSWLWAERLGSQTSRAMAGQSASLQHA